MTTPIVSPEPPQLKTCIRCGRSLPLCAFGINRANKDGLAARCQECNREYAHERERALTGTACRRCGRIMPEGYCKPCKAARSRKPAQLEKKRIRSRHRRKLHSEQEITIRTVVEIYNAQGGRCYLCGSELTFEYEVDHFIPVMKGGTNDPGNLRLACKPCNRWKKRDKHPHDMGILI